MKKKMIALACLAVAGASKARKVVNDKALAVGTALAVPVMAMAQTTDPFDTAMTTATTKVTSYAGALVGLSAVAVIFLIAIKYVKRIPRAS